MEPVALLPIYAVVRSILSFVAAPLVLLSLATVALTMRPESAVSATGPSTTHLAPAGEISGTLHDSNGKPAAAVTLRLSKILYAGDGVPVVARVTTSANGAFTFAGVPPHDRYILETDDRSVGLLYRELRVKDGQRVQLGVLKLVHP